MKNMERIIFTDGTAFEIKEGASIGNITVLVDDFASLEEVANALTASGNLDAVQFETNGNITGEYEDMVLVSPLFHSVDIVDGQIEAVIAIGEKSELEKRLEALEAGQEVQDGAIIELAEIVGGE